MKKYNRLIISTIMVYIMLALLAGFFMRNVSQEEDQYYRVEVNRFMHSLTSVDQIHRFDNKQYTRIHDIKFLSIVEMNQQTSDDFFMKKSRERSMIVPWYQEDTLQGYIKFFYITNEGAINQYMMIIQVCLFLTALFTVYILWYLRKHIVEPFHRVTELPMEIAKGHLKSEVKVEKSAYFKQFLWGMGQLKDTLDVSKQRQLELEKEKKQMLLSLSHDIKTPLNLIKLYGKAMEENLCQDEHSRQQAIHQIQVKANEIDQYVDVIMKTSREDIMELKVEQGEFYLQALLDKVLGVYHEQCEIRNITLTVHYYEDCLLEGDVERAQEVMENLFENAFKYGDGKSITLDFYEEDECHLIRLHNTGTGVNENEFNHLFDSFFRGMNSQGKSGSGLGLYICKTLMRKMDGDIFAEMDESGIAFVLVFR